MRLLLLADAVTASSFSPRLQRFLGGGHDNDASTSRLAERPELPGGSPMSLCKESSPTDLFNASWVELSKQPLYMDDEFYINIYGTFQGTRTWTENATLTWTVDCGSHCEMYGYPPGETDGASMDLNFCELHDIMQHTGRHKRNVTCPPVDGRALATTFMWISPWFLGGSPGWYNATLDARTADGRRIYCLTAEVCLRWEDPSKEEKYPKGPWSDCTWPR